jgi:hypothetical protein
MPFSEVSGPEHDFTAPAEKPTRPLKKPSGKKLPVISRRKFMRGMGDFALGTLATGSLVVGLEGPRVKEILEEKLTPESVLEGIDRKRRFIEEHYGVPVTNTKVDFDFPIYPPDPERPEKKLRIQGNMPEDTREYHALNAMIQELAKYPPDFIKKSVSKYQLVNELASIDHDNGTYRFLGAVTNPWDKSVIISTDDISSMHGVVSRWNHESMAARVHHENGHSADYAYNGLKEDDVWIQINPERDHAYGYKPKAGDVLYDNAPPGFATKYGRWNPDDDKATVSQLLFERPELAEERSRTDPVLAAKITEMKRRYYVLSDGQMDGVYWQDLRKGKIVDISYWEK